MNEIDRIYSNTLGISFYWKREQAVVMPKIQVVFKDVGFLLTIHELKAFSSFCKRSMNTSCCTRCKHQQRCKAILLRTPCDTIDLAVSVEELYAIHELLCETIIKVELRNWITNLSLN